MNRAILLFNFLFFVICFFPQNKDFGDKVKDQAKQSGENRSMREVDQAVNKAFDGIKDGAKNIFKKKDKEKKKDSQKEENNSGSSGAETSSSGGGKKDESKSSSSNASLSYYSKYDFVSGDKVVAFEDFSQDAVGDFPAKWNTNGSGEIVSIEGEQGKWLMINKKGKYFPEYIKELPENFTLEYDLRFNNNFNYYSSGLSCCFVNGKGGKALFDYFYIPADKRSAVIFNIDPSDNNMSCKFETFENGEKIMNNEVTSNQLNRISKNKAHISVWRQKTRLRVYVNDEKVLDIPRAFVSDQKYSWLIFELPFDMADPNDRYFISNIKLAIGAPDTRHKLIEVGKFSTTGIKFDSGSDKLKPESYGILKEIATVLKENPDVKIKIIGHTDSDGKPEMNLELSKKRAISVKNALVKEFGIDEKRMETDGKGQTEPVDSNDTPAGKANNRRVEFVKL